MLLLYGPYLPLRILEEIRFWKGQEKEHIEVIKAVVPNLEPGYVTLLNQWEQVFAQTEQAAHHLLQHALSAGQGVWDPTFVHRTEQLLHTSCIQSQEFIKQLHCIIEQSAAVAAVPLAKTVLLHIIRESQYFLCVLDSLNHPGELMRSTNGIPPVVDPHPVAIQYLDKQYENTESSFYQNILPQQNESESQSEFKPESQIDMRKDVQQQVKNAPVPIGGHTLPPLPYAYNALEPYIDEKTMRIHHDKHHKVYVDDLNKAEKMLQEARKSGNFDLVKHWERELAFNGAGHYLHTIFWDTMNPQGGGRPEGELLEQIKRDFGSYDAFHDQFSKAAEKVEGGGWAILVWSPRSHRLEILTAEKHQNLSQWDVVPLLPLDVWEHAYYLKHQNERAKYIEDWWNVVYWPEVDWRYQQARQLKWQPY